MTARALDELREIVGPLPIEWSPEAWWISTSELVIFEYELMEQEIEKHRSRVEELANSVGCKEFYTKWWSSKILGFYPPVGMGKPAHPEYRPIPEGWRIDAKTGRLEPKRRTKADRESDANKAFSAIQESTPSESVRGIPEFLWLPTRVHKIRTFRGAHCVIAVCGGNPDRASVSFDVNQSLWERLPLSSFHLLRESDHG